MPGLKMKNDEVLDRVEDDSQEEGVEPMQSDDATNNEIHPQEEEEEVEAPLLAEHATEPGGPAARTRSATAATGRRYFTDLRTGRG